MNSKLYVIHTEVPAHFLLLQLTEIYNLKTFDMTLTLKEKDSKTCCTKSQVWVRASNLA